MTATRGARPQDTAAGRPRRGGFIPALEGMRAVAAVGVMTTHVAFQTGTVGDSVLGRGFGRFDLAVAMFFGLSGFLLWRGHAQAARGVRDRPAAGRYYRSRLVRIVPANTAVVVAVLWLLPLGGAVSVSTWLANLTLTQVYVPYAFTSGLTQLWSLSVEMTFYLLVPPAALAMLRLRGGRVRWRIPVLAVVGIAGIFWGFVDLPLPDGINSDTWLPGHAGWFVAGMVLAEMAAEAVARPRPRGRVRRTIERPVPMLALAAAAYAAACTDLAGPPGLVAPTEWQYACKIALGAVVAFALLAPFTLTAQDRRAHRVLSGPVALALGRWSYAFFLWHVAVLSVVFPALGIPMFSGYMPLVWIATLVLTIPVSAASYALVEEPARRGLVRWEERHARRPSAQDQTRRDERFPAPAADSADRTLASSRDGDGAAETAAASTAISAGS